MENGNSDVDPELMIDYLRFRVKELESELKRANELIAGYQKPTNEQVNFENISVNSIKEKVRPPARLIKHLSWLGKVIFVLQAEGRPMSAAELYDEVDDLDGELGFKRNPKTLLSVVLHKAVKEKRLTLHKVKGTRGAYYALIEWTDENENLNSKLKEKLF
ncbi:MAG: hypothetical protein V4561_02845 [Bacteroidota bacterium]